MMRSPLRSAWPHRRWFALNATLLALAIQVWTIPAAMGLAILGVERAILAPSRGAAID
jgi:hypothetical protein